MHKIKENGLQLVVTNWNAGTTDIPWIKLQNINGAVSIEKSIV